MEAYFLSEKHLHHIVHQLPGPKMGTILDTVKNSEILKLRGLLVTRDWAMQDLNLRLLPCEGSTLATELIAQAGIINRK